MLDLVDEAFHQVPLSIQMLVVLALHFAIRAWWNHRLRLLLDDDFNQLGRVVTLVGNDGGRRQVLDQRCALCHVVSFAARQDKA